MSCTCVEAGSTVCVGPVTVDKKSCPVSCIGEGKISGQCRRHGGVFWPYLCFSKGK